MGIINFVSCRKMVQNPNGSNEKGCREKQRWERELGKYGAPRTEMIHVQIAWCLNKGTDKIETNKNITYRKS